MTDRRQFILYAAASAIGCTARAGDGAVAHDAAKPRCEPLRIAHLCDPQFGFATGCASMKWRSAEHFEENYKADLDRCARAIDRINEIKPDLLLFGGDMTQRPSEVERDWPALLGRANVPWMITPGNHDMGNSVTHGNLSRFLRVFGKDHDARDVKGWRIIAGNSQFWHPTELKDERAAYEAWLAGELERAKSYGGRVILASHIPPFAFRHDEKDSYDNHPLAGRSGRLESYVSSGARFYLSAHQHRLAVRGHKNLVILGAEATCDNGDLLACFYYRPVGSQQKSRCVTVRYAFEEDGLRVVRAGTPVARDDLVRGVGEPSLAQIGDKVYMTLRSDEMGLWCVSDDGGMTFSKPRPWTWTDGKRIGNKNTQQHWLECGGGLFLAYTREDSANGHVFRNRAPIYMAQFDPVCGALVRKTEFPLMPELGARLRNFCVDFTGTESWLVTAEWMQPLGCEKYGSDNSIWLIKAK